MFLFKLESRRQIDFFFDSPEFISQLEYLCGAPLERAPHNDTLAYTCERLNPGELHKARRYIIRSLLRSRALEYGRLLDTYWLIAVDATGRVSYHKKHCDHCLTATINGTTIYYHNTLEAKLVTPDGFALSIASEFIENESADVKKQDCELRAFRRMAPRLKKDFPQLPICFLGDSLYAAAPAFSCVRENKWHFIITLKEGSIPNLYREFQTLKTLCPENSARRRGDNGIQTFHWVNHLEHAGRTLAVIECVQKNTKSGRDTRFVWVTDMEVTPSNYLLIAKGGRLRWKIENEGFNTQKNGGYALEHAFCSDNNGAKNFYLLLQIAHIFNQLLEKGSLLRHLVKHNFGSVRNMARFILEAFRTCRFDAQTLDAQLSVPFQIRFDTS